MNESDQNSKALTIANRLLPLSVVSWYIATFVSQGIFIAYICAYYVIPTLRHGWSVLASTHLPKSYIPDDPIGNLAVTSHLFLASVMMAFGLLQLIPQIRKGSIEFHRWSGRIFMLTAFILSLSGLYMVAIRGAVGGLFQHLSLGVNAGLILTCIYVSLRYAVQRKILLHKRWALRLFMVASGVWFARVGLWLWVMLTGGAGINWKTFTGPFLNVLGFAQFLLPLLILELYFCTTARTYTRYRIAMAILLFVCTTLIALGTYKVSVKIWLPRIF